MQILKIFTKRCCHLSIKKILITVLCVLLLFLPTYIAIANYNMGQKNPIKAVTKIVVVDTKGNSYEFDNTAQNASGEIDGNTLEYFLNLKKTASEESGLPEPLKGTDHYTVTFCTYETEVKEEYYFSRNPGDCYYVDSEGNAFRLKEAEAKKFVTSLYAKCLYESAETPVLTLSSNLNVTPKTLSWNYMSYTGDYLSENIENTTSDGSFLIVGKLQLKFSEEPDFLSLVITDSAGTEIYNGTYDQISNADLKEGQNYKVSAIAKWYENIVREAYGEATYLFDVKVQAAPVFFLEDTSIQPGEFTVISGLHISDVSEIHFSSNPEINFTPTFFKDGDYVRALVPISIELSDEIDSYDFTVSANGTTQVLTLTMEDKTFKSQNSDISSTLIKTARTETTLSEFYSTVNPYLTAKETTKYFDGNLLEAVANRQVRTGFGLYRTLINSGETYRHEGVDYVVYTGDTVQSVYAGKVVYVGSTTLSGNTIIIEHGFGLKSLYAHLSTTAVKVGDIVSAGDAIGVVGSTGFTSGTGLHAGLYVFDTPVCPYSYWETGVVMTAIS